MTQVHSGRLIVPEKYFDNSNRFTKLFCGSVACGLVAGRVSGDDVIVQVVPHLTPGGSGQVSGHQLCGGTGGA